MSTPSVTDDTDHQNVPMDLSKWFGRVVGLGVILVGLPACAILGPGDPEVEKTYPEALDLERVSLPALTDSVPLPGFYNVHVYVVGMNVCPANARCAIPDGITISETPTPDGPGDRWRLAVNQPAQFRRRVEYVLSIEAESAGWRRPETNEEVRYFHLLGYSHRE